MEEVSAETELLLLLLLADSSQNFVVAVPAGVNVVVFVSTI